MTMEIFAAMVEDELSLCPRCNKPVAWKWATGPCAGFISEPHNVLVGDFVYHAECWDDLVAEHPPVGEW